MRFTRESSFRHTGFGAAAVLLFATTGLNQAAFAQVSSDEFIEEVVTLGVRSDGRAADTLPVPVDAFDSDSLKSTGQAEVGRMLQTLAPSFNFSSSTISDGTDSLRPATLRGLGPDQTLVLVNGKRRHASALLHVNVSVGRGTSGTDLNAIPGIAIKRIEILRDGAAAQYGSDAIAGVINLVLKDGTGGGESNFHSGQYSEGDGRTLVANTSYGWEIGDGGHFNAALEIRDRGRTNRAGLTGECQYTSCVRRKVPALNEDGSVKMENGAVKMTGETTADGVPLFRTSDPARELAFNRKSFRIGDADSQQGSAVINLEVPVGDTNFYLFSTYSERDNQSGGFYRRANQRALNPTEDRVGADVNGGQAFIENGFLPLINAGITDFSVDFGVEGSTDVWDWDFSVGYGRNTFDFIISNSLNASLVSLTRTSPRTAYAGRLATGLITAEFGAYRDTGWGSFAFGGGYKFDQYEIVRGEELSWRDYDTDAQGNSLGTVDAAAGIQVFPGFRPENEVNKGRYSASAYVDVEWNLTESLLITGAGRFENYSDFGATFNVKGAVGWQLFDGLLIRGAASTGFRAPSLQQSYFGNVSTQFTNAGVAQQVGTFRNDSELATALGIPELEEETSINISLGAVWNLSDSLSVSADVYRIEIEDRIVISGRISGALSPELQTTLTSVGAGRAQFFLNAADTRTTGADLVVKFSPSMPRGALDLSLGANITSTKITAVRPPSSLSNIDGISEALFTAQDRSIITEWQPETRISLIADYTLGNWNFVAGAQHYGEYTVVDNGRQTFGAKTLVDTSVSYSFGNGVTIKAGGNNILDAVPDTNTIGQSRTGVIVEGEGSEPIFQSPGVFQFSRRSAPFGFNGSYFYVSVGLQY